MIISLSAGIEGKPALLLMQLLVVTLLVGFAEEAIFRGLMLNALTTRGSWVAAIVTSVLFGLSHSLNVLSGKSGADIVVQIFYALAVGFAFAAVVLKKGIVWPLVIAHCLIDFMATIGNSDFPPVWNAAIGIGISFVFVSYGLFIMFQKARVEKPTLSPAI